LTSSSSKVAPGPTGDLDLDGYEWPAAVDARAFGVRFGVRVTDATLLPLLIEQLPPGSRICKRVHDRDALYSIVSAADGTGASLYADGALVAERCTQSELLQAFEGQVRFDVARLAARWTFVHAGVVEWHGRAILIPGVSYSGKSQLVEALVRAGARYYSDEFAPLDRRGRVYPFAKPLTLRSDDGRIVSIAASELDGPRTARPLPVGVVISTRYVAGSRWNPTEAAGSRTVLALLVNTVRAQIAPAQVLPALAAVAESAKLFDGERGEADQTVTDLLARISA
jgi:hypothetical protein